MLNPSSRFVLLAKPGTQSVSISRCGTFALVGSAGGRIDMFNLQSGLHQQSFPPLLGAHGGKANLRNISGPAASSADKGSHTRAVTGLMVDGLNRTVISCGLDGKVKVSLSEPPSLGDQGLMALPSPNSVLGFYIREACWRAQLASNDCHHWPSLQQHERVSCVQLR